VSGINVAANPVRGVCGGGARSQLNSAEVDSFRLKTLLRESRVVHTQLRGKIQKVESKEGWARAIQSSLSRASTQT